MRIEVNIIEQQTAFTVCVCLLSSNMCIRGPQFKQYEAIMCSKYVGFFSTNLSAIGAEPA